MLSNKGKGKAKLGNKGKQSGKLNEAQLKEIASKNQKSALFMFVAGLFLLFVVFIKGENIWSVLHNFVKGLFGIWSITVPVLLIYLAVITALQKYNRKLLFKILLSAGSVLTVCSLSYFMNTVKVPEDTNFFSFLQIMFVSGIDGTGCGLVGAIISAPMAMLFSETGAIIILILLLFVFLMILTNTTIVQLYKTLSKPVKYAKKEVNSYIEKREVNKQKNQEYSHKVIDIPLGNEKRKTFNKVISYGDDFIDDTNKNNTQETIENTEKTGNYTNNNQPNTHDYGLNESILKFTKKVNDENEKFDKQSNNEIKTNPVIAPHSRVVTPVDSSADMLSDAKKAAEEFIKSKENSDNNELASTAQMALYNENKDKEYTYCFPPLHFVEVSQRINSSVETEELQTNGQKLVDTLESFSVKTKIVDICRGPTVTRYEIQPAPGVRINKITNLSDDLALNLAAVGVRIEAPIPGKAAVGIEIPNKNKSVVKMRDLLESNAFVQSKSNLTVVLGKDITGQVQVADLAKMPHTLIAGTTGSGKSVCINSLVVSLMYKSSPDDVRFLMIDPKVVELGIYNGIPHLLVPVVTDPRKAAGALAWAVTEMLNRYKIFASFNVKDISGYNTLAKLNDYKDDNDQPMLKMPQVVIIIDELADLMMAAPNEVEDSICRLAQMARAAGMHLVVATQRPTVDVVTGLIKANIPSRIAFAVSSAIDSKTILDGSGAEKLLGQGDMLFSPVGSQKPMRIQGCFITEGEIEKIVDFVKNSKEIVYDQKIIDDIERNAVQEPSKNDKSDDGDFSDDPMMDEAIRCVMETGHGTVSLLQRKLRVGHARAGRLIDQMSDVGILGPYEGSKPRQLLMTYAQWQERSMLRTDFENNTQENSDYSNEENFQET